MATLQDLADLLNALDQAEDPFPCNDPDYVDMPAVLCNTGRVERQGTTWRVIDPHLSRTEETV